MIRRFFSWAIIVCLVATFFFGLQGTASAATRAVQPQVTCSGHGCDGKDPARTGCNVGAVHLGIIIHTWENQQDYQDNQVWWSNACQSNFGFVNSFTGQNLVIVAIFRSDQFGPNLNCNANNGTACTVNGLPCHGINGCDASTGGNALVYCATPTPGECLKMVSNTRTWETDLLYAPNQQIQVCQLAGGMGDFYCSAWH